MKELTIRKMTAGDLDSVCELEKSQMGQEAWSRDSFLKAANNDYYNIFIALINDEHVATVCYVRSLDEADVSNVCVSPLYRRQGIGYQLLNRTIELMIEEGVFHFTLEVREGNENAIKLYEKLGFENVGIRPSFYSNPKENAVIMWKHIMQ